MGSCGTGQEDDTLLRVRPVRTSNARSRSAGQVPLHSVKFKSAAGGMLCFVVMCMLAVGLSREFRKADSCDTVGLDTANLKIA